MANVLDKLPKSMQGKAKQALHDIYLAASRADAEEAFHSFEALYGKKFPQAVGCLRKDREELLTFWLLSRKCDQLSSGSGSLAQQ